MLFCSALPRAVARLGATGAAAGVLVVTATAPASAHVSVTPDTTAAGSYAVLTFSLGHGCESSPTREIAISIPESIPEPTPTINPGWRVEKVTEKLDKPIKDSHGAEVTERTSEIVYTADEPLEDGYRTTFEVQAQLPEDAEGETLTFPTVQSCVRGETGWTEVPAAGQSEDDLERPAPSLVVSASEGGGHGGAEAADTEEPATSSDSAESGDSGEAAADNTSADGGSNAFGIGGLVLGGVGAILGGAAFARTRKG